MNYKWYSPTKCWISDDNPNYSLLDGPIFSKAQVDAQNEERRLANSTYAELRQENYPDIFEQIDKLYHDIAAGKFGESATLSDFYLTRKAIKVLFPKVTDDSTSTSN